MNPVLLYFASGESLYSGAALLLLAIAVSPFLPHGWLSVLRNVSAWFALTMIIMACPPFPWIVDAVFAAAFLLWYVTANRSVTRRLARLAAAILASLLVILPGLELRHRALPVIVAASSDHLVVIGDSVSAGIDSRVPPWPVVVHRMTGIPVRNLSTVGAFTPDGLRMAARLAPEDRVILVEIGGNDLIAGIPSAQFGNSLEAILQKVIAPDRTVVMFELPLLPDRIAYGQIQRRLAKKYGVWLIPKRCFTYIIAGANATSDGLHLLAEGTHRMATSVERILAPVLKNTHAA